jgi:hypothetical protein
MNDPEDMLEQLLQEHLHRKLDPQLGRARARFAEDVISRARKSHPNPRRLMIWGLWAAGAMAASVGIVWGVAVSHSPPPNITRHPTPQPVSASTALASTKMPIEQIIAYRTLDEGPVIVENHGPARQLRRQVLETVQWYDPGLQSNVQITVPREQVVFVAMPSY